MFLFFKGENFMKSISKMALSAVFSSLLLFSQAQAQGNYDSCCEPQFCDSCCDDSCCNRWWVDAEYLYWTIKNDRRNRPLVISSPTEGAVLGSPESRVVIGNDKNKNDWRNGGRFALGYWIDDECSYGAEVSYFFLANKSRSRSVHSDGLQGSDFLSVPYVDSSTDMDSSSAIAYPGAFSGHAHHKVCSTIQNAELNGLARLYKECDYTIDALVGFRYWNFYDKFNFRTSSPYLGIEDVYETHDKFHVDNNFYGGQIGARMRYNLCSFFADLTGKIALGAVCQEAKINGHRHTNDFTGFGEVVSYPGSYFANHSNRGKHTRTKFAYIPEINLDLGYSVTCDLDVKIGYTFLYVSEVLWAGKLLDSRIDPASLSSTSTDITTDSTFPKEHNHKNRSQNFWAQGVSAGIEYRF